MTDKPRLIERAFPLKQASLTSVHEKNVRHGHISTLHIWPARRPLAACRAALLATLLPDPGTPEERRKLCERIGGKVIQKIERKKMPNGSVVERVKEEVEGGILKWIGTEPKSGGRKKIEAHRAEVAHRESELNWFREEIRKAYGGRAPRVLDPFAGGGAIPLEAMRLGCEATAVDINPVAWFILKCTLEYPQKLAGKTHPLPDFILEDEDFMEAFYKAHPHLVGRTKRTKKQEREAANDLFESLKKDSGRAPKADLAWHVRAWGRWVLAEARKELAPFYPTYADFEPLDLKHPKPYEKQEMRLLPLKDDGTPDIDALNAEFSEEYLHDKKNPRWVAKPTVAYLWARTVECKNCRASIPLFKTKWICKKDRKRVLAEFRKRHDGTGIDFAIERNVSAKGGNAAQRREYDKQLGKGTISRAGAVCPNCNIPSMTVEDIRVEATAGRSGYQLMAVVTEGPAGKEYREPTRKDIDTADESAAKLKVVLERIQNHSLDQAFAPMSTRSISAQLYGVKQWGDLFTDRQSLSLATICAHIHRAYECGNGHYSEEVWRDAVTDGLCLALDRLLSFSCVNACWKPDADSLNWAFSRFSISLLWDFAEGQPLGTSAGSFIRCNDRIASAYDTMARDFRTAENSRALNCSAAEVPDDVKYDVILTDPPYYQAVSYADLSDFSYVWLRGARPQKANEFSKELTGKTDEFVQHIREDKSRELEKQKYERQMEEAFRRARNNLSEDGRFVCVFAHKEPDAWETLVSAIIRSGFLVIGSWPIQTEMPARQRGAGVSALASSVWLVCQPRSLSARPGWDNKVLEEMRSNITERLHAYWDAGIRGPDFVWAATGPAMEAYSKHPIVKKANAPGEILGVGEFLSLVRRMVVDFVVGQVLTGQSEGSDMAAADRMDAPTAYYLLHRHDFGLEEAPAGACILYATACGLSDRDLEAAWDLVSHKGTSATTDDEEADPDAEAEPEDNGDSGSKIKLKTWAQRNRRSMGFEAPSGRPIPLIDRIHRLMHLWRAGDVHKVDEYLDDNGLRRQELFKRLVQSLIELSTAGSEERSLLESLSNHVQAKGATVPDAQIKITFGDDGIVDSNKEQ